MRAVIQRVTEASVSVDGEVVGAIDGGLLVFLGVGPGDTESSGAWLASKISNLRIFDDMNGKMNHSLLDVELSVLVISQFTLYGDCGKGRRPSFMGAAHPDRAEPIYLKFCEQIAGQGVQRVEKGQFGEDMKVSLLNDGPVTLIVESP